jgi:hypothetical protein
VDRGEDGGRVGEDADADEDQRLPEDDGEHRDVHRVANIAVEPADDERRSRGDRRRCAAAFDRELRERGDEGGEPRGDQQRADGHHEPTAGEGIRQPRARDR